MAMKKVSIQALKANLSAVIAEVESGTPVVITRHNTPVAQLNAARGLEVHRGARAGRDRLRPALKKGTGGRYLRVLLEDRGNR